MSVRSGLLNKSLNAAKWNYIGTALRVFLQIFVQVAFARMLGPESLGLFAFVFILIGIGTVFVEMGMGAYLIQKSVIGVAEIGLAFRVNITLGVFCSFVTYIFAGDISRLIFNEPNLIPILEAVSPIFVLQGLCAVPQAVLRRDLDVKRIQLYQTVSYVLGFLIAGLLSAYMGLGVWSIVIAWLVQSFCLCAQLHYSVRLRLSLSGRSDAEMLKFGWRVFAVNLANWLIENIDNFVVGRLLGAKSLGLYSVSYNLVRTPANHIVVGLQGVLFPASSRAQNDKGALRRGYLIASASVSLVVFPIFLSVAAISPTVLAAMFGGKWSQAAGVLAPLALAMIPHSLMAIAGPVLWGYGRVGDELKVQLFVAALLLFALWVASQFGMDVAAWAVFLVYCLRYIALTWILMVRLELTVTAVLVALRGGALLGACVAILIFAVNHGLSDLQPHYCMLVDIAGAMLVAISLPCLVPRLIVYAELRSVISHLFVTTGLNKRLKYAQVLLERF